MRGGIYSYQKCSICGNSYTYSNRRGGLFCNEHPDQQASGQFVVRFGRKVRKRFKTFNRAERFLIGLRYEVDRGTYDHRDYQAGNPLGFANLAEQWLAVKEQEVKVSSYRNLRRYMISAIDTWGNRNIKEIGFAELEDFLLSQTVSGKTRSNIKSCLHTFWKWLLHRKLISLAQFPDFPTVKYKLGYRKIIDKETQMAIVDEIKRISYHINPRIWLGVKWLCTYIAIRPGELIKIREQDVNTRLGCFVLQHTKEGKEKLVPMLDEDRELINALPVGLPDLPFFRHGKGVSGCRPGQSFGQNYLYKWWKKACDNLGVVGVDLYGGTRHSSATALKNVLSPEQIKAGTMHSTNKAFERYFQRNTEDAVQVYSLTKVGHERDTKSVPRKIVSYRN